ncbi:hypothetical protein G6661_01800 [Polynucleobacter paneuropaeus]|nr:hypothetical protein G6661_01800 [Polynucleobacter paneuropaeus]
MDLSIIVTGRVNSHKDIDYLQIVKKLYPEAREIIAIIWRSDLTKFTIVQDPVICFICIDELILESDYNGKIIAIPNQIYSAQVGIQRASSKYVLKLRFDLKLKQRIKLRFTGAMDFQKKIILGKTIFRCPLDKKSIFFISDLIMAGTKEDLQKLWNIDPYIYKKYLLSSDFKIILNGGTSLVFPLDRLLMFNFILTRINIMIENYGVKEWIAFIRNNLDILYDDENYIEYPKRFLLQIYINNYIKKNDLYINKTKFIKRFINPYKYFLNIIVLLNGIRYFVLRNAKLLK